MLFAWFLMTRATGLYLSLRLASARVLAEAAVYVYVCVCARGRKLFVTPLETNTKPSRAKAQKVLHLIMFVGGFSSAGRFGGRACQRVPNGHFLQTQTARLFFPDCLHNWEMCCFLRSLMCIYSCSRQITYTLWLLLGVFFFVCLFLPNMSKWLLHFAHATLNISFFDTDVLEMPCWSLCLTSPLLTSVGFAEVAWKWAPK